MSIKDIYYKDKLIAQKFQLDKITESVFPTPPECEFQFGVGVVDDEKFFQTHIHKNAKREIHKTSEFIYVLEGTMSIVILADDQSTVEKLSIKKNEGFLQYFGGHDIKADAKTRYFEIKQGPYYGRDFDKYIINEDSSK
jgi:hypothetical protein